MDLREVEVIIAHFKRGHTGITSTIMALLPELTQHLQIALLSPKRFAPWPRISWSDLLRHGFTPPAHRKFRIWHARRNLEAFTGIILRSLLGMPLKLLYTSAAQRHHSRWTLWLISRMDAIVATSPETAQYLPVAATIISHGVDTARYFPPEDRVREWAASGLPGRFGIAVFGRVRPQKGTDLFVQAMCRLLPRHPDFSAVIIGPIAAEQRPFARRLRRMIARAGLLDRIRFIGERPADEIPHWYRRVSIVVAPAREEGFGLVPLEAMASGCAVVATRSGAAHRIIADEHTGYLVSPGDVDALVERLETLVREPRRIAAMGQCGRAHVLDHFSIQREARQLDAVYQSLWNGSAD